MQLHLPPPAHMPWKQPLPLLPHDQEMTSPSSVSSALSLFFEQCAMLRPAVMASWIWLILMDNLTLMGNKQAFHPFPLPREANLLSRSQILQMGNSSMGQFWKECVHQSRGWLLVIESWNTYRLTWWQQQQINFCFCWKIFLTMTKSWLTARKAEVMQLSVFFDAVSSWCATFRKTTVTSF